MEAIKKMCERLEQEIGMFADKPEIKPNEWTIIFDAVDALKDLKTICAMDEYAEPGSSMRGSYQSSGAQRYYPMSNNGMSGNNNYANSYGNGNSYAEAGNSYGSYGNMRSGAEANRSYHGDFLSKAHELLTQANSEAERAAVQAMIAKLQ